MAIFVYINSVRIHGKEYEVLTYIACSMSNKQIACAMRISEQTVKNYVMSLMQKLGA